MSTLKVDTYLTRGGASEIAIDKLKGVTAAGSMLVVGEGGTTTTNLQQGLAKAWCHFEGSDATVDDSLNVTNLTDNGTGNFDVNYTNNMSNANFAPSTTANISITGATYCKCQTYTTASVRLHQISNGGHADCNDTVSTTHGDLA